MEQQKIIILGGGGDSEQSLALDTEYINNYGIMSILYIPIALQRDQEGYSDCYKWISNWVQNISKNQITIDMCLDLSQGFDLDKYDSVYLGGGNTFELLYQIKINNWDTKLIQFYNRGGVIYGGSAGAIILGKSIETVPSEYLSKIDEVNTNGLGLVDYLVRCHYNQDKNDETLNSYLLSLQDKYKTNLLLLAEDEGLIVIDGIAKWIRAYD
jgi:dipeptidase E